jgi:uncharacterized protein (DUF433 family)
VTVILDALAGGDAFDTIQRDYDITAEDIRACLLASTSGNPSPGRPICW